jgi:hypothetical protein
MTTKLNRRTLLQLSALAGVGGVLAACSSPLVEDAVYQGTEKAPVAANPAASTAATSQELVTQIADAATAFLHGLSDEQRATASYAITDPEYLRWHWTTTRTFPRNGVALHDLAAGQQEAAYALLRASVSEVGFQKSMDIMGLQPEIGGDPLNYYVTLFGAPGDPTWGWRFEGHHLSRRFTIAGDKITITPFFHGVWPTVSEAGKVIMPREEWAARELMHSLDDKARAEVIFQEQSLTRHVTWDQNYVQPLEPVGAPLAALNNDQQALAMEILQAWMATQAAPIAQIHLDRIQAAGPENLRFGWAGSLEERRPHYYRIQGPTFLLEYDNTRNGSTHIHSVWRVFDEDFGQGLI